MSSEAIQQLFTSIPHDEGLQTQALSQLLNTATHIWESDPSSSDLDLLAEKAGDGSRQESWRIPLGQSGLLDFFLSIVATDGLRSNLIIHTLRVIGNSCADVDENRARVVQSGCLPKIVSLLNDDSILAFVIPVLYNICVDYEPAQVAVFKAGLNPELVNLLSNPEIRNVEAFMNFICKLLSFVAAQEPEAELVHPATPFVLLSLATNPASPIDVEDFIGFSSVALTYLSQQQFQQTFLETPNSFYLFCRAFSHACGNFDHSQIDVEDQEELKKLQSVFMQALADLSANPLVIDICQLAGPEVTMLRRWISTPYLPLQSAACLALGNIARSDKPCTYLVQNTAIHDPLIAILANPSVSDVQLLHAVLSFLKNLAIPTSNKAVLGDAGLLETHILPRLWELDTQPQVQFAAASLTRLLLVNCPANVRRICSPLSADPASPANDRTKLHLLMDLHKRSDDEPTKMETARAVATVCRVLHSTPVSPLLPKQTLPGTPPPQPDTPLQDFYSNHSYLPNTLLYLGIQKKFPALRSELWFVFALMARTSEGSLVVARSLQEFEIMGLLIEAVTGEKMLEGVLNHGSSSISNNNEPRSGLDGNSLSPDVEMLDSPDMGRSRSVSRSPSSASDISMSRLGLGGLEPYAPQQAGTPQSRQSSQPASSSASSSHRPPRTATQVDRENGLVLLAELLQKCPTPLLPLPKRTFRRIMRAGGELVLADHHGTEGGDAGRDDEEAAYIGNGLALG
ncbi:armadillo-type protein [Xylariomycetidae sp. FL2044]|nr:armadillo-type protein [Xylariomycetidae sp. FL2044]